MKNKIYKMLVGARLHGKTAFLQNSHHEILSKYCRNFLNYCKDVEREFCNVSDILDDKIYECTHCQFAYRCKVADEIKELRGKING